MENAIRIYNGNQIGGCITIISTRQAKIVIDYGEQLPGSRNTSNYEIDWEKEQVDAVLFTHYHGDHIGRFHEIPETVPLYMGSVMRKVMQTIAKYLKDEKSCHILQDDNRIREIKADKDVETEEIKAGTDFEIKDVKIKAGKVFPIGDMKITPYMVDHSAYDAYMYLIETPEKTILHTGDFRMHGYRGKAVLPIITKLARKGGKRKIDILITEGTMMSRLSEQPYSEMNMQREAKELFRENKYAFLICSSTNVDSLATFYQAAQAQGHKMNLYANDYVVDQLKIYQETAGAHTDLYDFKYAFPFSRVKEKFEKQEKMMRDNGFVMVIKAEEKYKKWIDKFADLKPVVIYSMWDGYLDPKREAYQKEWKEFLDYCEKICGSYIPMHTSGHASAEALAKVIEAVEPQEAIIPIHTENAKGFYELEIREELKERIQEVDTYEW